MNYEDSLKYYRDLKNSLDTAQADKVVEIAQNAIGLGFDNETISKLTGLSIERIDWLRNE
ncbi:MAG: hypothetical protein JXR39_14095 [Marinilabiliaceae bacterium]|nr:hypothetical protein [Marinilabiliaceae bacterium]